MQLLLTTNIPLVIIIAYLTNKAMAYWINAQGANCWLGVEAHARPDWSSCAFVARPHILTYTNIIITEPCRFILTRPLTKL